MVEPVGGCDLLAGAGAGARVNFVEDEMRRK
jgi:hypothetical protein